MSDEPKDHTPPTHEQSSTTYSSSEPIVSQVPADAECSQPQMASTLNAGSNSPLPQTGPTDSAAFLPAAPEEPCPVPPGAPEESDAGSAEETNSLDISALQDTGETCELIEVDADVSESNRAPDHSELASTANGTSSPAVDDQSGAQGLPALPPESIPSIPFPADSGGELITHDPAPAAASAALASDAPTAHASDSAQGDDKQELDGSEPLQSKDDFDLDPVEDREDGSEPNSAPTAKGDEFDWDAPAGAVFGDLVEKGSEFIFDSEDAWAETLYSNPETFEQFDVPGDTLTPGCAHFSVLESDLSSLCEVLSTCTPRQTKEGPVKLTLINEQLRAQFFTGLTIIEFIVPAQCHEPTLEIGQRIVVTVLFEELLRAAKAVEGSVDFHLSVEPSSSPGKLAKRTLQIRSGDFLRPLTVSDAALSPDWFQQEIDAIDTTNRIVFDAGITERALKAVAVVAEPDQIRADRNLAEFRGGTLIGGKQAIAVIKMPPEARLDLRVRVAFIEPLIRALQFCGDRTALLTSPHWNVIRGERIAFGFEKHPQPFPHLNFLSEKKAFERLLIPRSSVEEALKIVLQTSESGKVRFRFAGQGNIRAHLSARSKDGRDGRVRVDCRREGSSKDITMSLDGLTLIQIARVATGASLEIFLFDTYVMVLMDLHGVEVHFYLSRHKRASG